MSTDRVGAAVETAIAEHVADAFRRTARNEKAASLTSLVRTRITDRLPHDGIETEQDNHPPALVAFYRRIAAAFVAAEREPETAERDPHLTQIKGSLETLRSTLPSMAQRARLDHARGQLLIERQHLLMKNELTEGFGRIEVWILSVAFLALVLQNAVGLLWALPFLGLSIGRAWYLDGQCKRRLRKIAEIDALIDRIGLAG
ncbi:hypothetical protein [Microvirga sesbaniae]|uniref:hypothetical protein n=1 Tax=Microvirga sesbaniae TaxID=681392 RepID=UPI0021CAC421|nr:hypothetical protein [Microvirga sp. HBU67692]